TTSCNWYKAPSGTSIGTSSSYTATTLGSYYVVCSNAFGCSSTSNVIQIDTISCDTCNPENYSLGFGIIRQGCNTDSFVYNASNVFDIGWDFGDIYNLGTNYASGNNVTHTYTEPGVYKIKICGKVPDASTTSSDSCLVCRDRSDTINYIPDFYATVNCVDYSSSYTVTFNNITKIYALAPTPSYAWSINGGGTLSTSTDFTTSLSPGTYNITLTISGVCDITKSITIVAPTSASFTASDSVCVGAQVLFNNTSSPILDQIWDFGDGASSLLNSPYRSYSSAGSFNVNLTITNQYGCLDSAIQSIVVLPNNLSGILSLSGPNEFCFGDSVDITVVPSGGYPPYNYLWTTTSTAPTITAKYTGNYGVDIYDDKGCFYKVADTVVLVNPIPNSTILGKTVWCEGESDVFFIASPYPANSFLYTLDGVTQPPWYGNTYYYNSASVGSHSIKVEVTNSFGCKSKDSLDFIVHPNPNVAITSTSTLCEGDSNILVANSTSTNLVDMVWSTGLQNDTLITPIPNNYQVTVTDSNGCEASDIITVHRLPDLCGMMVGCYEICDTVTQLVWYAPTGYTKYQWYFNGTPIVGSTSDTLHIPLYQAGAYSVVITNSVGCEVESDLIDITFVPCGGCDIVADVEIACGPVDAHGNQTYNLIFNVNSTLANGASISITSPDGIVSSLSTSIVNNGANIITGVFTDISPYTDTICFDISIWDQTDRCDTTICIRKPPCKDEECEVSIVSQEPFDCIGFDGSGNPMYYGCVNINWAGSNGTQLTLVAPNSSFSPNPITVNNGANYVCFTYTDLPPLNPGGVMITAFFYDSITQRTCCDSFRIIYKPCKEKCLLDVTGLCAHCEEEMQGGLWSYNVQLDVTNPMGTNASVSIVPIPEGSFGPISPNPIPPGTTTINTIFTDLGVADSIICFRVILTNVVTGDVCYKDICLALPPCDDVSVGTLELNSLIKIYPNPASDNVTISISDPSMGEGRINLTDINGRLVRSIPLDKGRNLISIMLDDYPKGVYILKLTNSDQVSAVKRLIIE
ncbi:MAG: T9SS type A sorting domain-containing protein, partial [Bacteroidia bacterium]|nr:T9SS type A sorting domain-containing protein [Bacteroidia bacterium]